MKAKNKNNSGDRKGGIYSRRQKILLLFLLLTYLLNVALLILGTQVPSTLYNKRMDGFQEGRVAPFNLVAETDTFYTDVERTERLRKVEAEKILPVYRMDEMKVLEQVERFEEFAVFFMKKGRLLNQSELFDELSSRYPDTFTREDVEYLLENKGLFEYLPVFEDVLVDILEKGIFPEQLELNEGGGTAVIQYWHWRGNQKIHERYTRDQITTADRIDERVEKKLSALGKNEEILNFATILLKKFARQNTFYDPTITEALRKDAAEKIGPVSYEIQKGQTIVREGEVVSADDMQRIRALMDKRPRANLRESVAIVLYLFGIFFLAYIMYAPLITNKPRFFQYSYILMVSSVIFTLNIFFVLIFSLVPAELPLSLGIMTALISMLIATLMTQRIGIISSLLFSLLFVAIPGLDFYTFVFSFLSGITATYLIRNAERRIDLVTATVQLAVVVIFIIITIGLFQQKNGGWYLYAG